LQERITGTRLESRFCGAGFVSCEGPAGSPRPNRPRLSWSRPRAYWPRSRDHGPA